jgi:hypothetical protein
MVPKPSTEAALVAVPECPPKSRLKNRPDRRHPERLVGSLTDR